MLAGGVEQFWELTLELRREPDDSGIAGGIMELQEGRAGAEELGRVPGGGRGEEGGRKTKSY